MVNSAVSNNLVEELLARIEKLESQNKPENDFDGDTLVSTPAGTISRLDKPKKTKSGKSSPGNGDLPKGIFYQEKYGQLYYEAQRCHKGQYWINEHYYRPDTKEGLEALLSQKAAVDLISDILDYFSDIGYLKEMVTGRKAIAVKNQATLPEQIQNLVDRVLTFKK